MNSTTTTTTTTTTTSTTTTTTVDLSQEVPEEFICPLTQDIMEYPLLTKYGFTFEKAAIVDWVDQSQTCPMTRRHLTVSGLVRNVALEEKIRRWKQDHGWTEEDGKEPSKDECPFAKVVEAAGLYVSLPEGIDVVALYKKLDQEEQSRNAHQEQASHCKEKLRWLRKPWRHSKGQVIATS